MIKATYNDKALIVTILSDSFDKNKSVNYVVKQDDKRNARIKKLMEYSFEICYSFGEVLLSNDKKACALILFPDKKKASLKTLLLDAKLAISCIGLNRISKVLNRDSKIKSFYPKDGKILYLWFIGVQTTEQSKGIGSSVIKEITKISEDQKRPIYLETSMPENVIFYKKLGFEVYEQLDFGHVLSLMKRNLDGQQ